MTRLPKILVSLLTALPLVTASTALLADEAKVTVKVSLFPVGSFEATSNDLVGTGTKKGDVFQAKELKVPVKSLVTGIGLRDTHMRERLLEKEHPFVLAQDVQARDGAGTATMTIAGVSQKVEFKFKTLDQHTAQAQFKLKLPDFKIADINYKGVGVEDEVDVTVTVAYDSK